MRYHLVIFDFDGTLADSFALFAEHLQKVIEHFQLRNIDPCDVDSLRSGGAREVIDYLRLPYWKVPAAAAYMRRLMASDATLVSLFPESAEMLRRLFESGVTIVIASSNTEANVRKILGPKITPQIECFACGSSLFGKAAKFRSVLKKLGVAASETLAIGDELRDMDAAHACGIDFGAVAWGYTKVEAFRQHAPAFIFTSISEIQEVLV